MQAFPGDESSKSRTPQGVRGLKLSIVSLLSGGCRRTPQGVRGLKLRASDSSGG